VSHASAKLSRTAGVDGTRPISYVAYREVAGAFGFRRLLTFCVRQSGRFEMTRDCIECRASG